MKIIILLTLILFFSTTELQAQDTRFTDSYPSGKLKSVKHEGLFGGCHMPVGTDTFFYESGKMKRTVFYDNRISKKDAGCHEGWTTEISKEYFENGLLRTISQTKYGYEGSPCNCGTWIWNNNKGRRLKKKYYGKCYDQVACD